jgi:hypothetical protein
MRMRIPAHIFMNERDDEGDARAFLKEPSSLGMGQELNAGAEHTVHSTDNPGLQQLIQE